MQGIKVVKLYELYQEKGERETQEILSSFDCKDKDADVHDFLRHKAIEFCKQRLAGTFLVFVSYKDKPILAGYYALAQKDIEVIKSNVSNRIWKKLQKYSSKASEGVLSLPTILLGQFGKNFKDGNDKLMRGSELLDIALEEIALLQYDIGGKFVSLDCKPNVVSFYRNAGFIPFGKRNLRKHEGNPDDFYIQMLKEIKT